MELETKRVLITPVWFPRFRRGSSPPWISEHADEAHKIGFEVTRVLGGMHGSLLLK